MKRVQGYGDRVYRAKRQQIVRVQLLKKGKGTQIRSRGCKYTEYNCTPETFISQSQEVRQKLPSAFAVQV